MIRPQVVRRRIGAGAVLAAALTLVQAATGVAPVVAAAPPIKAIATMDLSKPFATRSPWRFTATQGPDTNDTPSAEGTEPGAIRLCISKDGGRSCHPSLNTLLIAPGGNANDTFSQPHYLGMPTLLHPATGVTLLRIEADSLHAGNGDQLHGTALLRYDRAADAFVTVYERFVGHNNNQEIRYIDAGPLRGAVITAEPTQDAPFGYWITISRFAGTSYKQALRYRSATRYGDNNPLAVIDAEMPNIFSRLGLWHSGQPLPRPAQGCARPHMVKGALWC
uniref:hypothetical protein n=1 Tax=Sphingomonas populi TaxID=2484750 RepID=UPI0019D1D17F|nr:hypothetical protein [Sphingomonas populi]